MYLSTALALASSAGLATAFPTKNLFSRDVTQFAAGSSWDIVLNKGDGANKNIKSIQDAQISVIDIDLFDTSKDDIATLKKDKLVICYFSAGSRETWRPDAKDFQSSDYGKGLEGWENENWVNVKSDNVFQIMKKRIALAAANGCHAVDPDNVDGYQQNQDGWGYDKSAYAAYVNKLAAEAKSQGLAVGLKNAVEIIPDVVNNVQFAVNEECHKYSGECAKYKPFTDANKAVYNIEYGGNDCSQPAGVKLSELIKPSDQSLTTVGGACKNDGDQAKQSSGAATAVPTPSKGGNSKATAAPTSVRAASSKTTPAPTSVQAASHTAKASITSREGHHGHSKATPTPTPTPAPKNPDDNDDDNNDDDDDDDSDWNRRQSDSDDDDEEEDNDNDEEEQDNDDDDDDDDDDEE